MLPATSGADPHHLRRRARARHRPSASGAPWLVLGAALGPIVGGTACCPALRGARSSSSTSPSRSLLRRGRDGRPRAGRSGHRDRPWDLVSPPAGYTPWLASSTPSRKPPVARRRWSIAAALLAPRRPEAGWPRRRAARSPADRLPPCSCNRSLLAAGDRGRAGDGRHRRHRTAPHPAPAPCPGPDPPARGTDRDSVRGFYFPARRRAGRRGLLHRTGPRPLQLIGGGLLLGALGVLLNPAADARCRCPAGRRPSPAWVVPGLVPGLAAGLGVVMVAASVAIISGAPPQRACDGLKNSIESVSLRSGRLRRRHRHRNHPHRPLHPHGPPPCNRPWPPGRRVRPARAAAGHPAYQARTLQDAAAASPSTTATPSPWAITALALAAGGAFAYRYRAGGSPPPSADQARHATEGTGTHLAAKTA